MTVITVPATKLRKNLFDFLDKLKNPAMQIVVTYKGRPRATMVNAEEFNSNRETLDILADKKLMNEIKQAEKEYKKGEYLSFEEVFGAPPSKFVDK